MTSPRRSSTAFQPQRVRGPDALLHRIAALLTSSVDVPTTLNRLGGVLVPLFADWCSLVVRDERAGRWHAAHVPRGATAKRWREPIERAYGAWMRRRLALGRTDGAAAPLLVERVTDDWIRSELPEALWEDARIVGARSMIFLPLDLDGTRIGAILLLVMDDDRPAYTAGDLVTAERVAALAAAAVRNARLWETIGSELVQRRRRHENLRETLTTIGTLCSGLSHDLGNVLQALRLRVDSLQLMELPPNATADLRAVADALGYLQRLAHSLRILAADARHESAEHALTRLRAWANDTQALIRHALPPSVDFDCQIPVRLPPAQIPSVALTQVVFNLVHSAGEALASANGGKVRLRAERVSGEPRVRLTVEDNGPTLSPDSLARLFDAGFVPRERPDSGMGLRLARSLVQRAGGDISVTSTPGRGTRCTVTLPIGEARARRRRRLHDVQIARVTVEDPRTRSLVTRTLQREGYFVDQTDGMPHRQERVWVTDRASAPTPDRLLQFVDRPDRIAVVIGADLPAQHPRIRRLRPGGSVERLPQMLQPHEHEAGD